jgi:hypothetical protein
MELEVAYATEHVAWAGLRDSRHTIFTAAAQISENAKIPNQIQILLVLV